MAILQKKVSALGFQITLNPKVTFNELIAALKLRCDEEIANGAATHVLYLDEADNYIIGSAITLKGHKKSIESRRDDKGNLIITRSELAEDATGLEPTLFVINPRTQRGLYYRNYGSPSLNSLKRIFRSTHDSIVRARLKETVEDEYMKKPKGDEEKSKRKIQKRLKKEFEGALDIQILVTPDDLANLMKKYEKLNRCEITATEALLPSSLLTPLSPMVLESRTNLRFDNKGGFAKVKNAVLHAFKNKHFEKIKLIGRGFDGEDLQEFVGQVKEYYHSYTYDEFVEELPEVVWLEYTESRAMSRLLDIIAKNTATFGKRPKGV